MSTRGFIAGTNLEFTRSHNRRVVLEAVRRAGPLSRAEIARETALTGQTISNIVEELEQGGLLVAGEPKRGGRGQPSVPFTLNPRGAFSLGFHVDHRAIVGALIDLSGRMVARTGVAARKPSPSDVTATLPGLMDELIGTAGVGRERILGAGLALPVRFNVGPITTAGPTTLPGWDDPMARERIAAAIGLPVLIENDAMAAAIRERLSGIARSIESFIFLFIDEGLGAGLILGGQPWRGSSLNAGEIGHMIVEPGGRPCPCGNLGCLERYVSLRAAYESLTDRPDEATPDFIETLMGARTGTQQRFVAEAAPRLARAVAVLESTLDPDTIILGGIAPEAMIDDLIAAVEPLPVSVGARAGRAHPRLMRGSTGQDLVALGAASLPIYDEINPRFDVLLKR